MPWRRQGGAEVQLLLILDLGTRWGEWSASRPGHALPRERTSGNHCTGGWVGLRAGLDTEGRGKVLWTLPEIALQSSNVNWTTPAAYIPSKSFKVLFCKIWLHYITSLGYFPRLCIYDPRKSTTEPNSGTFRLRRRSHSQKCTSNQQYYLTWSYTKCHVSTFLALRYCTKLGYNAGLCLRSVILLRSNMVFLFVLNDSIQLFNASLFHAYVTCTRQQFLESRMSAVTGPSHMAITLPCTHLFGLEKEMYEVILLILRYSTSMMLLLPWVLTPCGLCRCQHYRDTNYCLHLTSCREVEGLCTIWVRKDEGIWRQSPRQNHRTNRSENLKYHSIYTFTAPSWRK
jgi:hypothetical protein